MWSICALLSTLVLNIMNVAQHIPWHLQATFKLEGSLPLTITTCITRLRCCMFTVPTHALAFIHGKPVSTNVDVWTKEMWIIWCCRGRLSWIECFRWMITFYPGCCTLLLPHKIEKVVGKSCFFPLFENCTYGFQGKWRAMFCSVKHLYSKFIKELLKLPR